VKEIIMSEESKKPKKCFDVRELPNMKPFTKLENQISALEDQITEKLSELPNYGVQCNDYDGHTGVVVVNALHPRTYCTVCGGEVY